MSFQDEDKTAMAEAPVAVGERTQVAEPQTCPVCGSSSPGTEKYCVDCGFFLSETPGQAVEAAPPLALLTDAAGREYPLRLGENLIGRDAAEVLIADNTVSRKHARITVSEDAIEIEDLGSTNGTDVDGRRIAPDEKVALRDGSEIVAGSVRLALKVSGIELPVVEEVVEVEPTAVEVVEAPPVAWLVLDDGTELPVREGVNGIGRRAGNDVCISSDQYISGAHAELSVSSGQFTLTDLGSTNGTMVNGEQLEPNAPRAVTPEDEIVLGRTTIRLKPAEAAEEGEQADDAGE